MIPVRRIILGAVLAVAGAGVLYSCQSTAQKEGEDEGDAIKLKIENCTDPDSVRILADQARAYAEKLEAQGQGEEAASYLKTVIPVIQSRDSSAVDVFDQLKSEALKEVANAKRAVSVKDSLAKAAAAAKDSAVNAAKNAGDNVKDAATGAVEAGKNKAKEVYESGKQKTKDAVESGKQKTKDAVEAGKQKARDALGL